MMKSNRPALLALTVLAVTVIKAPATAAADAAASPPNNFTADEQTPATMRKPKPAFPQQTGAPTRSSATPFDVQTVTVGLAAPWSFAFLPNGKTLVTESAGTLQILSPDGRRTVVGGVPPVRSVAAQGLHDIVLDPDFAHNRLLYLAYFAPPSGEPGGMCRGTWPTTASSTFPWPNDAGRAW